MARVERQPRGFTLLELVLVMMILAITVSAAAPMMRGFMMGRSDSDASVVLLKTLQYARSQAIANGVVYQLRMHYPERNQYQLHVQARADIVAAQNGMQAPQGDDLVPVADDLGQVQKMPTNTQIEMMRQDGAGSMFVNFYPSGRCDVAEFQITGMSGSPILIKCDSPTEAYRIVPPTEARR